MFDPNLPPGAMSTGPDLSSPLNRPGQAPLAGGNAAIAPLSQAPAQSQLGLLSGDPFTQASQAAARFQHMLGAIRSPVMGGNNPQQPGSQLQQQQGGFAPFAHGYGVNSQPQGGGF